MGLSLHISIVPVIMMVVSLQVWLPLGSVEEERIALLNLKNSLNYPNGTSLPSWIKGDARCCDWELVVCNNNTGRVTRLYLSGVRNGQLGDWYLNASLFLPFQELYQLNLRGNQIAGWVENKGFLNLKNLEHLDLSFNTLNNNIFQTIVMMTSLKNLRLQGCSLNGQLPTGLCDLNHLQELLIYDNNLSGFLPPCLANLTSLQQLDLSANHLKIPMSLSPLYNLSKLKSFDGSDNEIYAEEDDHNLSPKFQLESLYLSSRGQGAGAFPKFLYHQFNLQSLDLTNIQIKGEFPSWLIENNTYLQDLSLENCSLSGPFLLPRSSHMNLSSLSISMNNFQGQIPAEIRSYFPGLEFLMMSDNGFDGSIPSSLGSMSSLQLLDLSNNFLMGRIFSNNSLQGQILGWIGNMSSLIFLDLSRNNLSGPLPPRIGASSKLSYLYLSRNKLQGPIAMEFHNSCRIMALDLSHNNLTGRIPEWIGRISNLRYLLLSHNNLEGEIPVQLCRLEQLTLIDLSHNYLSGNILSCMISTHPIQYLDNYYYQQSLEFTTKNESIFYNGSILQYFSGVDFSCNNFTGKIPLEIGNLSKIKALNLSHNSLIGSIPPTFSNIKEIESLDLSYNKLEGEIPPQLIELYSLAFFSVANNNLSGKTPARIAQFATFEESCYKDNPFLCGQPLPKACGLDMPPGTTYRREIKAKMAGLGVGVGFGALFLFIGLWWLYKVFKRKRGEKLKKKYFKRNGGLLLQEQLSSGEVNVEKIKMFPSKELDKATDHYNVNRTLGQGGQGIVYKGMLVDGKIVAIKKSKVIDEGNLRQFINEVVLLSQINHRNVVKLLGCCLETELPLLVYEFIPNGTLFQFLHDPNEEFPLTWEIRLRIGAEVAGALFYLHSAASIAIFHRDIKSTNILLDEKYRAKVADFGTSRSVSVDQTHVTTLVQGTFGYLDPEYFQSSQFTDKSDVYSFGVVLVELLTGQKPISFTRTEEQGRSLATYFLMAMESNCLFDILDPQVVKQGKKEDVVMVASLARSCLRLNGKERPTMKEVTMVLERIQKSDSLIVQREIEYDIKEVMGAPWDATSPSTISSFSISASSSLYEKPLFYTY